MNISDISELAFKNFHAFDEAEAVQVEIIEILNRQEETNGSNFFDDFKSAGLPSARGSEITIPLLFSRRFALGRNEEEYKRHSMIHVSTPVRVYTDMDFSCGAADIGGVTEHEMFFSPDECLADLRHQIPQIATDSLAVFNLVALEALQMFPWGGTAEKTGLKVEVEFWLPATELTPASDEEKAALTVMRQASHAAFHAKSTLDRAISKARQILRPEIWTAYEESERAGRMMFFTGGPDT